MKKIADLFIEQLIKNVLLTAVFVFAWKQQMSLPSFLVLVLVVSAFGGFLYGIYEAYKEDK